MAHRADNSGWRRHCDVTDNDTDDNPVLEEGDHRG
jgi:hypothetical protein